MSKEEKKKKDKKVLVVGSDVQICTMFKNEGWTLVDKEPSLVCFTGGADVTPFLYGEKPLKIDGKQVTFFDPERDLRETKLFHMYSDIPKVGICRGGQFLNVMSGGRMYQHVTDHAIPGTHEMKYISGHKDIKGQGRTPLWKTIEVTSTHHQMMRPGDLGEVIGVAGCAHKRYTEEKEATFPTPEKYDMDTEVVYYWHTSSLCYQPHPEYAAKDSDCRTVFFEMISNYHNF